MLLIQLTDSHLYGTPERRLCGMNTADSLRAVVALVRQQHPEIAAILATGDLSQDESAAAYQHFVEIVAPLHAPLYACAGNHDEARLLAAQVSAVREFTCGAWTVILLNSSVAGCTAGHIAAAELAWLEQRLEANATRPVLLAFHHYPLPVGCAWLDPIGLTNADALFACLAPFSNVRALLCGHVHQPVEQSKQSIQVLASPSTCIQFAANSAEFAVSGELPGYRWLRLLDNGTLETGVQRLPAFVWNLDLNDGY